MKKFLLPLLLATGLSTFAQQDLTGTWEGEFVRGTIGIQQPAKMVLEIVQVEGKLYGVFDLYPIDTRAKDRPNITYTVEGKCTPETVRFTLFQGRIVEGTGGPDWTQFTFEVKRKETGDFLTGQWFRELEPVNSRERGQGTFTVRRVAVNVSDRLLLPKQEKYILKKLEKQTE